jgi:hypothetical protein
MSVLSTYLRETEACLIDENARTADYRGQAAFALRGYGAVSAAFRVDALLDGGPSAVLRIALSVEEQRTSGAFFTGRALARKLVKVIPECAWRGDILDPTCGAGDLLLAAAARLPVREGLAETLSEWGKRLAGSDVSPEFVRLARLRLAVLALTRGANHDRMAAPELGRVFPRIAQGDALHAAAQYENATCILLNPPFGPVHAPPDCAWATGRITAAALFAEKAIGNAWPGTHLAMILPDVLRSGSRYGRWRACVQRQADMLKVQPHGLFDKTADIDVFLLHLRKRRAVRNRVSHCAISPVKTRCGKKVGEFFDVHVGPVVPYRDKGSEPLRPYIAAKGLPRWCTWEACGDRKRTDGKGFRPPFVVVRRTSRPGDAHRATGTIITGHEEVAVENHLLALTPKDGTLRTCRQLLARLKDARTTRWLDSRIRCRHLTVSAVKELPWWD